MIKIKGFDQHVPNRVYVSKQEFPMFGSGIDGFGTSTYHKTILLLGRYNTPTKEQITSFVKETASRMLITIPEMVSPKTSSDLEQFLLDYGESVLTELVKDDGQYYPIIDEIYESHLKNLSREMFSLAVGSLDFSQILYLEKKKSNYEDYVKALYENSPLNGKISLDCSLQIQLNEMSELPPLDYLWNQVKLKPFISNVHELGLPFGAKINPDDLLKIVDKVYQGLGASLEEKEGIVSKVFSKKKSKLKEIPDDTEGMLDATASSIVYLAIQRSMPEEEDLISQIIQIQTNGENFVDWADFDNENDDGNDDDGGNPGPTRH